MEKTITLTTPEEMDLWEELKPFLIVGGWERKEPVVTGWSMELKRTSPPAVEIRLTIS